MQEQAHSPGTSNSSSPTFAPIAPDLSFPWRLFRLLQDISDSPNDDIIAWLSDGKRFQIKDHHRLEQELLSTYFKTSKYESFRRQLLNYGFECVNRKKKICKNRYLSGKEICATVICSQVSSVQSPTKTFAEILLTNATMWSFRQLERMDRKCEADGQKRKKQKASEKTVSSHFLLTAEKPSMAFG